jgi:hypothetical protein
MGFQSISVWKLLKRKMLEGNLQIEVHQSNQQAEAHDRLMVR